MIKIATKFFIIAGLLLPAVVSAEVGFQPGMLVVAVDTNRVIESEVLITNKGQHNKSIGMDLEYYWQKKDNKNIDNWIEIKPKQFILNAGESKKIIVRFKKLGDEICGECQVILLAREKIKSTINLNIEIGMTIYVRVNQASNVQGEIIRLMKEKGQHGTWYWGASIRNTGEMFLLPFGIAWIEKNGKRIWQHELRLRKPLAPGKTDVMRWQVDSDVKADGGNMSVQVFWGSVYGILTNPPKSQTAGIRVSK